MYRILYPHWDKTLSLNAAGRDALIPQVVKDITGLKPEQAFHLLREAYKAFDWVGNHVPNELAGRGIPNTEEELKDPKWKNYGYAKNLLPMWYAIRKYVMSMLLLWYSPDADDGKDKDKDKDGDDVLPSAPAEMRGPGGLPSFPAQLNTPEELCDTVTMCIHVAAPFRSTVNYLQNFYRSFVAARPPSLCMTPPRSLAQLQKYREPELARALPHGTPEAVAPRRPGPLAAELQGGVREKPD